jgi:transcriptional regulator with XRE-family HTH domain
VATSWDATGRLAPIWKKVGGRDKLADRTGIQAPTLSGYNTGRLPLGERNARKIAAALEVSLLELGAPEATADDPASLTLVDRLTELVEGAQLMAARIGDLEARLEQLEARPSRSSGGPAPRRKASS